MSSPTGWTRRRFLEVMGIATASLGATMPTAKTLNPATLARKGNRPFETHPGLDTSPGVLVARDGTRLRTITTRPAGLTKPMPAILFVQWLSDSSIELPSHAEDGWSRMIRRVVRESGMVVMRTDKRGVGDSEGGPCSKLDYLTELSDHRDAFDHLAKSEFVDPKRIIVFGASMGGNFAPLVALDRKVAGVIVWGGGARTWFERTLAFERNRRELSAGSTETINREMREVSAFLHDYLIEDKAPAQIARENPALGAAWKQLTGTEGETHYGRPLAFHQQAQKQDWTGAWAKLDAPALVLFGEYDWFEDAGGHALIERIVRRKHPEHTRFRIVPQTDHHFTRFARPEDAVSETGGTTNEGPAVEEILTWLREVLA